MSFSIAVCLTLVVPLAGAAPDDWAMHDPERPWPATVTVGPVRPAPPPSDAVVLFDGTSLDGWHHRDGSPATWKLLDDGSMQIASSGKGELIAAEAMGDQQLHIEWMCPADQGDSTGQGRGNSGVFVMSTYEIQVLSTHENRTYADGMGGAVYGQYPPDVNPCRPMGEWNVYDMVFHQPRFAEDGSLEKPATLTMHFNGVLVHDHVELLGPASFGTQKPYKPHPTELPVSLQDHSEPVRYRNIWARPLD